MNEKDSPLGFNKLLSLVIISTLLSFSVQTTAQTYVDASATGNNNGSSWTNAYTDLQTAINATTVNAEIWVATGTYLPTISPDATSADNRDKAFHINTNRKIYGGFDGTETQLSQRNPEVNPTYLSGDLGNQNDTTDNAYHVLVTVNLTSNTVIDGFIIIDGNAHGTNQITYNTTQETVH